MDRAFSSGASGTPPSAPGSPSIGYPTSGNAGTGTPPTKPGAYWYHMVTEEIRGVLVAAGLTPSQADVTQLLQALRAAGVFQTQATNDSSTKAATTAFANPGASLASSGYQKLPSGLIIQWMQANCSVAGTANTLPIAFTSIGYMLTMTSSSAGIGVTYGALTASGFTAYSSSGTPTCAVIAIGK